MIRRRHPARHESRSADIAGVRPSARRGVFAPRWLRWRFRLAAAYRSVSPHYASPSRFWLLAAVVFAFGCRAEMYDQSRLEPFEPAEFFEDKMSARPLVPGTIAKGALVVDEALATGREKGEFVLQVPLEVDQKLLERGRDRYDIFCSMCHGLTGEGNGIIVQRGLRPPPSFHIERLQNAPAGHYFDVITHGFGAMPRYAVQIEPRDRWAIVAYVRALQLSQQASLDDVPADARKKLLEAQP